MRALLDTHAFLWWIADDPNISDRARKVISDNDNQIYVSAASGWEIAIKAQIGRLTVPEQPERFILEQMAINAFISLPVRMEHALRVYSLPMHHRDPFDRILIAQSQVERLPILTADSALSEYSVDIVW
ncbi:MAG: type II toxin-antitoxin system VapC family toxin [Armatimonadetes bacterium]|nr:type II toxin-antitoxin system VapC family toxin [Armatimonadota bacterium]